MSVLPRKQHARAIPGVLDVPQTQHRRDYEGYIELLTDGDKWFWWPDVAPVTVRRRFSEGTRPYTVAQPGPHRHPARDGRTPNPSRGVKQLRPAHTSPVLAMTVLKVMRGRRRRSHMRSSHSTIVNSILTRLHEDEPAKLDRRWVATRYGVELLTSMMILLWSYHMARAQGAVWAIITAILILQPGLDKSMSASGVFIVATLLGASAGTVAALLVPREAAALLAGVLVTVILCHLFHLDLHVRVACLTVPIVQTWHQGSIIHVDYERTAAILAGCVVAVIVQFAGVQFRRQVSRRLALTAQITSNEGSR